MKYIFLFLALLISPAYAESSVQYGSGFFVDHSGTFITNYHVVHREDGGKCNILARPEYLNDDRKDATNIYRVRIIAEDKKLDLFIGKIEIEGTPYLTISKNLQLGQLAAMYGFPLVGLMKSGMFTLGYVSALYGIENTPNGFSLSTPTQPGNSGGAVIDNTGAVIGVIQAKLDALNYAKYGHDIPQLINFAIKQTVLVNFMNKNSVKFTEQSGASIKNSIDLADIAKHASVLIGCVGENKEPKKRN